MGSTWSSSGRGGSVCADRKKPDREQAEASGAARRPPSWRPRSSECDRGQEDPREAGRSRLPRCIGTQRSRAAGHRAETFSRVCKRLMGQDVNCEFPEFQLERKMTKISFSV